MIKILIQYCKNNWFLGEKKSGHTPFPKKKIFIIISYFKQNADDNIIYNK